MHNNFEYKPEREGKIYPQAYYAETERARPPEGPPRSQAYYAERAYIPETPSYRPPHAQQQSHMHQLPQLPIYPPPPQVYVTVHVISTSYPPAGMPYQRVVAPPDKHAGLAITGFVLGLLSLLGSLVFGLVSLIGSLPCGLGFYAACAGLTFSIIGLQSHQHKSLAIAGLICSALGIGISVIAMITAIISAAL